MDIKPTRPRGQCRVDGVAQSTVPFMARDERAIAKVRELRANMTAPFFVALGTAHDRGILTEARVRGNETLEDLREFYLMFELPGNHP